MRSVPGHHEEETPGVSDCEHAYVARAIGRLLRIVNYIEPLAMTLSTTVEVSGSR
jgi:hypothetical protein